jgi:hypothetical protein
MLTRVVLTGAKPLNELSSRSLSDYFTGFHGVIETEGPHGAYAPRRVLGPTLHCGPSSAAKMKVPRTLAKIFQTVTSPKPRATEAGRREEGKGGWDNAARRRVKLDRYGGACTSCAGCAVGYFAVDSTARAET